MSEPDVGLWQTAANWLWAGVLALGGWAWKHTHKRIDDKADKETHQDMMDAIKKMEAHIDHETRCFRAELKSKTDKVDYERTRSHVEKLFDGQEQIRKDVATGFANLHDEMGKTTIMMLEKLNEISASTKRR